MTREEVKAFLNQISAGLDFISKLTPTTLDDKLAEYVHKAIALEWPVDLIMTVINLINKDNVDPAVVFKVLGGLTENVTH